MRKLVGLTAAALLTLALGVSAAQARTYYGGGHHTKSHGGHYAGGHGSSHKGGHYKNPKTGDHYGRHK